jgi:hypothetical protein
MRRRVCMCALAPSLATTTGAQALLPSFSGTLSNSETAAYFGLGALAVRLTEPL